MKEKSVAAPATQAPTAAPKTGMNPVKPVNVYVVLCQGSIDRKLESLIQEKSDAAELVLDGRLIGERQDEVNLAELLRIAQQEFNEQDNTLDEALLHRQWIARGRLRDRLAAAIKAWDADLAPVQTSVEASPARTPSPCRADSTTLVRGRRTRSPALESHCLRRGSVH